MEVYDTRKGEDSAYLSRHHHKMTVQDALIAIATYAARIDLTASPAAAEKIATLASQHGLFEEDFSDTLERVNKFANQLKGIENPSRILKEAGETLSNRHREIAWELVMISHLDEVQPSLVSKQRYHRLRTTLASRSE